MLSSQAFENQFSWITSFPRFTTQIFFGQHSSHPLNHHPSNPPNNKNKIFIITAASSSPTSSSSNNNHHRQIHAQGFFFPSLLFHIFNFPPHNTSPTSLQVLVASVVVNGRLPFALPLPAGKPIKQRNGTGAQKKNRPLHSSIRRPTLPIGCDGGASFGRVAKTGLLEWTFCFNFKLFEFLMFLRKKKIIWLYF